MSTSALTVSNLSCMRGGRRLFAPVSFELTERSVMILRGENGSGKSTLLRTLAGLMPIKHGTMQSASHPLYLGHANALHPSSTVLEHVQFWRELKPTRAISDSAVLETLGLSTHAFKLAAHLSNGQKRRLSFARLLMHPSRLWLLDEPQAALDAGGLVMFLGLLNEHLSLGSSAIIASHDALNISPATTLELRGVA
ncbi:MAG: heme ABC exporter ATP-binding protein CcmA [Alphaproteobacteria bacterium]|nr:heme ABC exporter ATP-binding protein CcmA [Alphaproteobacteria bacterium]